MQEADREGETMTRIEKGVSPETFAQQLTELSGAHVSARSIRARARKIGACHIFGKAMILMPEDVERLLEDMKCDSSNEMASGGTTSRFPAPEKDGVRERLIRRSPKTSRRKGNGNVVVPLSTAPKS